MNLSESPGKSIFNIKKVWLTMLNISGANTMILLGLIRESELLTENFQDQGTADSDGDAWVFKILNLELRRENIDL